MLCEALRHNPKNASAHAMLGYVLDAQNDRAGAADHYEKAIALGSNDAAIHLVYGMTLLEREGDPRKARLLFERAAQLDPNDARAWAGVGMTYINEPSGIAAGIAALEKSLALAPSQEDAAVNLIQLYAESGRRDDARRLYEKVLARSTNDEYQQIARKALEFADVRVAERMFDEGKYAEAIDAMRAILAKTEDAELQDHLRGVIAHYDEQAAVEQQNKTLREILAHANAGRVKEARALIDALLPKITDDELRAQLVAMRKELVPRR
jgi:tetratricopeptide (TPR) repeat protein